VRVRTEVEVDAGGGAIARCYVHGLYTERTHDEPVELPDVDVISIAGGWPQRSRSEVEDAAIEAAVAKERAR
jgi:hypothetical protein